MSIETFDPYGLALPANTRGEEESPKAVSIVLSRVGQGVFWLLAIVIVASRIAYFSPDYPFHSVDVQRVSSQITR